MRDSELETAEQPQAQSYLGILQIARRRKSLILLGAAIGLVLGALFYAMQPPVYEAKAQLLVIKKRPEGVTGLEGAQAGSEDYLSTQAGILKSPLVVNRAVQQAGLGSVPGLANSADPVGAIATSLKVMRDPKDLHNSILELSYQTSDQQGSTVVLTAIIDAYKSFLDEAYRSVSDETVKFVTKARDELEKELSKKEEDYRALRRKTPVLLMKGQNGASFNGEQLLLLHAKQLDLEVRRQEIEGRLAEIDKALKEGRSREGLIAMVSEMVNRTAASMGTDGSGRVVTSTLEDKLLPALLDEKMLLEDYGPNHPEVMAAQKKVDLAREFVTETLKHELNDLKKSEELLSKAFSEHTELAKSAVEYDIDEDGIRSDTARLQQLYDVTIKRLQDADMLKDLGGYDAQAIAPPTSKKVGPKALMIFPCALFLGLLLGCGMGYWAEVTDKTFRSAEEIRQRLALPVVGHIPRIELKQQVLEVIAASGSPLDPTVYTHHRPKSREAESYRGIRTALYFSTRGSGQRVIQVTSPNPGDGKSTLAANLAVSIAQSGKRVLLIDADLRKPKVHRIFGVSATKGLAAVLAQECPLAEAVRESGVPGLALMLCGKPPANPAELLTSARLQEVLQAVREQYDMVLIDTPPLLAVTDPSVVAARVDGVLITLRITKNGRPQAERARDILQTLGAPILGVVVNGVASRSAGYGGGYGYKDGYTYYSRDYSHNGYGNGNGNEYYESKEDDEPGAEPPAPPKHEGNGNGTVSPSGMGS
jgi:capsular exopolysaccharide synthesis family protein